MEPAKDQCAYYFAKERITNLQIRYYSIDDNFLQYCTLAWWSGGVIHEGEGEGEWAGVQPRNETVP